MHYIDLADAVNYLIDGKLMAIPTETVYGLAANIHNEQAILNIYKVKNRPLNHPLIVHIHKSFDIEKYAYLNSLAIKIIEKYWPCPLTIVLPKTKYVPDIVTARQDTVALRCPNHALTQAVLTKLEFGIAAPSANKFGYISPTKAEHVYNEFLDCGIDIGVLDGKECEIGIESSIIMINSDLTISILRQGMFNTEQLLELAPIKLIDNNDNKPRISGELLSHYSPANLLIIVKTEQIIDIINNSNIHNTYIIFEHTSLKLNNNLNNNVIIMPNQPNEYAKSIYNSLRIADKFNTNIYLEQIPEGLEWTAIHDRLKKASYNTKNILRNK